MIDLKIIRKVGGCLFNHIIMISLLILSLFLPFSNIQAAEDCGDAFYIDEQLPNGARWDMCWEHRNREGITFHDVYYTPKNGQRRMVLNHAAVAQIHVPYDDNGTRFHDLSDLGIGDVNMLDLEPDECPSGKLLPFNNKNVLCKQIQKRDFSFKSGTESAKGYSLNLFSVSPVGSYFYIPKWRFFDDGTIEPWMGATGALQRFGTDKSQGWLLADTRVGIAHLHNFFWKLDFDLNKTHLNDVVEEVNFTLVNGKREQRIIPLSFEAARKINPDTMRHWRIRDDSVQNTNGHNISYDIILNETGHQDIGPSSEPFTHNDFFVTKQNSQEKFASHNTSGAKNLAEYVNGESIENNDIVVWAGITFYHMPRSEDAPHMDAHWSHLQIIPRDWHASNSLSSQSTNSVPTIVTPDDQVITRGSSVSLIIEANDTDGDSLIFSISGQPNGLSIDSTTGRISGTALEIGDYQVQVTVSDGKSTNSSQFSWLVSGATDSENTGGGGTFSTGWLVLFISLSFIIRRLRVAKI